MIEVYHDSITFVREFETPRFCIVFESVYCIPDTQLKRYSVKAGRPGWLALNEPSPVVLIVKMRIISGCSMAMRLASGNPEDSRAS